MKEILNKEFETPINEQTAEKLSFEPPRFEKVDVSMTELGPGPFNGDFDTYGS
ncbi:hypothetical protein PIGHUM_03311 [Pigmentiphaga humi]|uniref:Uncharacterized protein n=1 Tax=Pigmentiphaga humi TaxID=2478468 RepID=A0A3P4B6K8_9BURK|nr:hypothetical protein [Pigmentiphaga humi]VCU71230.1 hypothetical protein PIGHUM_03311 [Pigmentiphaga humi]